ncbi:DUF4249 domain-containing protein [Spirosoma endophyticum]|uniref:DUF4249 domain-containing protein n=1 Tax=Spirosoma endophyticum TaxID=662367 RepID=A0A1I1T0A7_9BACT|nr:DUF4249 domain-containing protein [Spirosoma endophyticum]SFD52031.1 protein of unknown function [Spirosoma endophyticum]
MKIIYSIFLFFLTALFLSCSSLRNEVDPSQLGVESAKLVVSSFLSPQDTTLAVKVTRSATVVGDSISLLQTGNNITDATVTLSEGNKSVRLPYNNVSKSDTARSHPYYSVDARLLPIIAGHTYTLTVVTANGQQATSTCTIPAPVQPKDIVLDSLNRRYFIRANWQDPGGQVNYYQAAGIFRYILTSCKSCQMSTNDNLSFDDDTRGLFSDAGVDGSIMFSGRAYLTPSGQQANFYSQYKTASVLINLMSVDQAYYRYQEAVIRQRRSRNNPFAEPVLIPSNIEGGLGCFAGYNNAVLTLKLK